MIEGTDIVCDRGVVASDPPGAARIGAETLEAGGNAMDAAVAASMACCMLRPDQTGMGGYVCCAVVLDAKAGRVWSVDANSIAPAAAHETMYEVLPLGPDATRLNESEYGCSVKDDANVHGPLAVGPPGMMAGMGITWERWGRLPWPQIVEPSLKLLSDGFPYGSALAGSIRRERRAIDRFPVTAQHLMPSGTTVRACDVWHRPDMERTLARVASAGWRDFYEGEIGCAIADYIGESGGILTRDDMASYEPRVTEPYSVTFGDATVHGPILTNGCLSSLQILNMVDALDLPREDSPMYWHLYAEILKRGWRDRLEYLADPDFVDVPVARLLSADYAAERTAEIRQHPERVDRSDPPVEPDGPHGTVHVSAADADGNAVSMTISQGGTFGSCVTVPGTGIILGHGMCRLDPRPGRANSVSARKRPLNNTAPMLVRTPERDIAVGLPGGRKIISVMPRVVDMMVRRGATGHEAAVAPRGHVEAKEPVFLTRSVGDDTADELQRMGHAVESFAHLGGCINCAEVLKGDGRVRAGSGVSAAGA